MKWVRPFVPILAVAGIAAVWMSRPSAPVRAVVAGPPAVVSEQPAAGRLQGVASCAAAACHNANGPAASKGSEYTTWAVHDPHARAYRVLFEERSVRMIVNLRRLKDRDEAHPEKESLCLSCHVHPHLSPETPRRDRFSKSDGVGCEACHGPAEKWLSTHYRQGFNGEGMTKTKDLRVRADVCVRCHVGDGEMDVNHDLIAAGHPRLRFEYGAYLASYPSKHWKTSSDKHLYPDLEARAWLIGQLSSAEAALKLLNHRATEAQKDNGKPWPEFAEYNCAACHHDLTGTDERQQRGFGNWTAGALPWGTWYYPLLPVLDKQFPAKGGKDLLKDLNGVMRQRVPSEKETAAAAAKAAKVLRDWLEDTDRDLLTKDRYLSLLTALASDEQGLAGTSADKDRDPANWDGATQLYLAIAAVHHGLSDLDAAYRARPGLPGAIRDMCRQLEAAFPEERDNLYNSPSRLNVEEVAKRLKVIQERLK